MKAVIQRVNSASVTVDGKVVGSIKKGFLIFLGVAVGDTKANAELLAQKISKIRIFDDENDKINLSLLDIGGEVLAVSQFTLCADIKKGNRPSFVNTAMEPENANRLYEYFCECLKNCGVQKTEKGIFGADMQVELVNDGPYTIVMDTDIWRKD